MILLTSLTLFYALRCTPPMVRINLYIYNQELIFQEFPEQYRLWNHLPDDVIESDSLETLNN